MAAIDDINAAVTRIQTDVANALAALADGGLTESQAEQVVTVLNGLSEQIETALAPPASPPLSTTPASGSTSPSLTTVPADTTTSTDAP